MPEVFDDKSTLAQVMGWCHQAPSHYLSQCWFRSVLPCSITRPQFQFPSLIPYHCICKGNSVQGTHIGVYMWWKALCCSMSVQHGNQVPLYWHHISGTLTSYAKPWYYGQCTDQDYVSFSPLGLSDQRGIVIACVSLCLSVHLSIHPFVRELYHIHTITHHRFELESPNLQLTCILEYSQLVLKIGGIDLDPQ